MVHEIWTETLCHLCVITLIGFMPRKHPKKGDDNSPVIFLGNPVSLGLFNSYLVSTYYVTSLGYNKILSTAFCSLEILSLVKVMEK